MIRRLFFVPILLWALGLAWFGISLPGPVDAIRTDGVVVLTGGGGRLLRGLTVLKRNWSRHLLVSGVDRSVKPGEFSSINQVPEPLMRCCIELGQRATDTVSNGAETAAWVRANQFRSVRLITSDWHMRRARLELERELKGEVSIVSDGVATKPSLGTIMLEYNKFLLRRLALAFGG